jgi:hypothetical protein
LEINLYLKEVKNQSKTNPDTFHEKMKVTHAIRSENTFYFLDNGTAFLQNIDIIGILNALKWHKV